eukprot:16434667-Heterocapsa_arctica.AAC.1
MVAVDREDSRVHPAQLEHAVLLLVLVLVHVLRGDEDFQALVDRDPHTSVSARQDLCVRWNVFTNEVSAPVFCDHPKAAGLWWGRRSREGLRHDPAEDRPVAAREATRLRALRPTGGYGRLCRRPGHTAETHQRRRHNAPPSRHGSSGGSRRRR